MKRENILFVDDEQDLLKGIKRAFFDVEDYRIDTALSGKRGLEYLSKDKSYAVVVSDMRMPEMDGIEFLAKVKEASPDTVRMMLTGQSDQETAVDAVNEGQIFRFLNKPCPNDKLLAAIHEGVRQYRLVTAEKELLEKTLMGSIQVMTDMLALVNPFGSSRARDIRNAVIEVAQKLGCSDVWQLEAAALLSQIGSICLPADVLQRYFEGEDLGATDRDMLAQSTAVASRLIAHIPRLEKVSSIIAAKDDDFSAEAWPPEDTVVVGAMILQTVETYDKLRLSGLSHDEVVEELLRSEKYSIEVVNSLADIKSPIRGMVRAEIPVESIQPGMVFAKSLTTSTGMLLVPRGYVVNDAVKHRLINFCLQGKISPRLALFVKPEWAKEFGFYP